MCDYKTSPTEVCGRRATYGLPALAASRCARHPEEKMVTGSVKLCKANLPPHSILCPSRSEDGFSGFCSHCFHHLFPADPKTRKVRDRTKEMKVVNYMCVQYPDLIHDRPLVYGDCDCLHRRRIDLRMVVEGTLVAIEIDEEQHGKGKGKYTPEQEAERYNDIMMIHGGKMVFIRFNPDVYCDATGKKTDAEMSVRLALLEGEVKLQIDRIRKGINDILDVSYLFYDGYHIPSDTEEKKKDTSEHDYSLHWDLEVSDDEDEKDDEEDGDYKEGDECEEEDEKDDEEDGDYKEGDECEEEDEGEEDDGEEEEEDDGEEEEEDDGEEEEEDDGEEEEEDDGEEDDGDEEDE
jgi:hypothetical protein